MFWKRWFNFGKKNGELRQGGQPVPEQKGKDSIPGFPMPTPKKKD